jgi:hypothetical protein
VLSDIDNLTARSIMGRVDYLARRLFERDLAHVTTVRQRFSPDGNVLARNTAIKALRCLAGDGLAAIVPGRGRSGTAGAAQAAPGAGLAPHGAGTLRPPGCGRARWARRSARL